MKFALLIIVLLILIGTIACAVLCLAVVYAQFTRILAIFVGKKAATMGRTAMLAAMTEWRKQNQKSQVIDAEVVKETSSS